MTLLIFLLRLANSDAVPEGRQNRTWSRQGSRSGGSRRLRELVRRFKTL